MGTTSRYHLRVLCVLLSSPKLRMARHDVCACCQLWSNRTLHLARGEAGLQRNGAGLPQSPRRASQDRPLQNPSRQSSASPRRGQSSLHRASRADGLDAQAGAPGTRIERPPKQSTVQAVKSRVWRLLNTICPAASASAPLNGPNGSGGAGSGSGVNL